MSEIGKRIKDYIKSTGENVKDAETKCGLTHGTIAKESNIRVDTLAKIISCYPNMDVKFILTGAKSMAAHHITNASNIREGLSEGEEYLKLIIQSQQAMIKAQQDTINTMMSMKGL